MPANFIVQLAIGVGLAILGYLLLPKPPRPKPPSVDDLENPTAEAGRPIPVVFGSITLSSPNLLGYWDKSIRTRQTESDGSKK